MATTTKPKNWRELRARTVTPEQEPKIKAWGELMRAEQILYNLRKGHDLSQQEVADRLEVSQSNVSQLERADDMMLSTLDNYIAALGGRLEICAVIDGETIKLGA